MFFLFYYLLHMHTFGLSVVEVFKLFFCHGVSEPIKNCAGFLP